MLGTNVCSPEYLPELFGDFGIEFYWQSAALLDAALYGVLIDRFGEEIKEEVHTDRAANQRQ